MDDVSSASVKEFRTSMPVSYRRTHSWAAIQEHAAIVQRRQGALVHIEPWRVRRGTVIVIVSDDRAGGLSMMSAAIAVSGFDILVADAYCRERTDGPPEAVALFELRRARDPDGTPLAPDDLAPIARALESLFEGRTDADALLQRNAPTLRPGPQASPEVTFADADGTAILLVEARDRPGLLATITSVLVEHRARIVDSEIVTVEGRARDRFHLTDDKGKSLSVGRRLMLVKAVLQAIERSGR